MREPELTRSRKILSLSSWAPSALAVKVRKLTKPTLSFSGLGTTCQLPDFPQKKQCWARESGIVQDFSSSKRRAQHLTQAETQKPAEWKPNQPAAEQVPKPRFQLGLSFRALGHDVTPAAADAPAGPREGVSAVDSKPAGWAPPWSRPSRPPLRPPGSLDTPPGLTHCRRLLRGGCGQKQQQQRGAEEHQPARRQAEGSRRHGATAASAASSSSGDSTRRLS